MTISYPAWARWNDTWGQRYTLGVEEEVMLLDATDFTLAPWSDDVPAMLPPELVRQMSAETHAAVVEFTTDVHAGVGTAARQLDSLRADISQQLDDSGIALAAAGTHPLAGWHGNRVSGAPRYRDLTESMRGLVYGPPTMGLHVHVGIPDPEDAVRVMNALSRAVPVLLALSANSPFVQGRDGGLASERIALLQRFPRMGTARHFADYADYVAAVGVLIDSGAMPDPTFIWWDVRLQPSLGTVEVRVMDAQATVDDAMPLVALIQSIARLTLEGDAVEAVTHAPEVHAENRFIASRDGTSAYLIDGATRRVVGLQVLVDELIERCRPHAAALGCLTELERARGLALTNGADRQRAWVRELGNLNALAALLASRFTGARSHLRGPVAVH